MRREEAGGETEVDVSGTSSVVCPQWSPDLSRITGQEDCLLLNVYVPGNIRLLELELELEVLNNIFTFETGSWRRRKWPP